MRELGPWLAVPVGFGAAVALPRIGLGTEITLFVVVALLLAGLHREAMAPIWLGAHAGLAAGVTTRYVYKIAQWITRLMDHPPDWDFLSSWVFGKVGAAGVNFYRPEYFQRLELPIQPTRFFAPQILDVGFWYPPTSILVFVPLGLIEDPRTAFLTANAGLALVLLADVYLLWRLFFSKWEGGEPARLQLPRSGWPRELGRLLAVAALVLMFPATATTFQYTQTNFVALLAVLLAWHLRGRLSGGVWLGVGMLVKPYLGLLSAHLLLRRYWRALAGTLLFTAAALLVVIAVYGVEVLNSFVFDGPGTRIPLAAYVQDVNQSLLAQILRFTEYDLRRGLPLFHPAFLTVAGALFVATFWLAARGSEADSDRAFALVLLLALIVYPGALIHYSFVLLFPLSVLWGHRECLPGGAYTAAAIVGLNFVLLRRGFDHCFAATVLDWLIVAGLCVESRRRSHGVAPNGLIPAEGLQ